MTKAIHEELGKDHEKQRSIIKDRKKAFGRVKGIEKGRI